MPMPMPTPMPRCRCRDFQMAVFLDITKAFDRVWHEGLIYRIKCMGAKGDLLALIESFLFE